jgi:Fe-S oxidoreductase
MATREERHSTRGRARLLFEMMHGGAIEKSWRNPAVEEALDLCLACKGCKGDCPVNVDMATYKAEFRAHYYAGRLRPRAAYSMGLIHRWARIARHFPRLANAIAATGLAKRLGGIAPERRMPRFAGESFVEWFRARGPSPARERRAILFPDTFSNHFRPDTAIAATRVLEAAGWQVDIPTRPLCCGRPLYDWGMLDSAKKLLRQTLETLRDDIFAGVPLIGLEPACVSAFRDELPNLLPDEPAARILASQTFLLGEFIDRQGDAFALPEMRGKAVVQWHCHHHAVLDTEAELRVLKRLGLDVEVLPSGCCGMAGSFGFEAGKYELSLKAAERVLLPRLRDAEADTWVIADGFSCREQIEQNSPRTTRHLAEVIAEGMGL